MAVITLARQVGSGGSSIATALAGRLGYRLFDRHALREEAKRLGLVLPLSFEAFAREDRAVVAESSEPPHLHVGYGELEFDQAILGRVADTSRAPSPSFLDSLSAQRRDILIALHAVVLRIASMDRVIFVGAGTQILLSGVTGVLRTKIVAEETVRAARLTATYGLAPDDALRTVRQSDQEQRDYNTAIYGADWDDPLMWDVVINSDRVSVMDASACLAGLIGNAPFDDRLGDGVPAALRAAADINLLFAHELHPRTAMIFAAPEDGGVVIHGETTSLAVRDAACELAESVATSLPLRNAVNVFREDGPLHVDQSLPEERL